MKLYKCDVCGKGKRERYIKSIYSAGGTVCNQCNSKFNFMIPLLLIGLLFIGASCEVPDYLKQTSDNSVIKETPIAPVNLTNTTPVIVYNTLNANGNTNIIFFDKGKVVLIKTPTKSMLIDSGSREDALELVAKIRAFGITNLTYLVLTHPHEDSIGGANVIYLKFKPTEIYDDGMPSAIPSIVFIKKYRNITYVKEPEMISMDSATVTLIPPYEKGFSLNMDDNAIQVQVETGNKTFYLFGDCGKACEDYAQGDVFQISASNTQDFLLLQNPQQVIMNRKGMTEYSELLAFLEIPYKSTETCGDILVNENGIQAVKC